MTKRWSSTVINLSKTKRQASKDARQLAREYVEDSCGCTLCDLGLTPEIVDDQWMHVHHKGATLIPCGCPPGSR